MRLADANTRPGDRVVFAGEHGSSSDQVWAKQHDLFVGEMATVVRVDISNYATLIELKSIPGVWFNSVLFNVVEDAKNHSAIRP